MPHYTIFSDKVEISAPREIVWDILIDLKNYDKWNPFTYRVDTTLKVGDKVDLYVRMPKRGDRVQQEQVRAVNKPSNLAWGMTMGFDFLLKAYRDQRIEHLSDTSCSYQTSDAFDGLLTPLVIALFREDIQNGFNNLAYALKQRAELFWSDKQASTNKNIP